MRIDSRAPVALWAKDRGQVTVLYGESRTGSAAKMPPGMILQLSASSIAQEIAKRRVPDGSSPRLRSHITASYMYRTIVVLRQALS